MKKVLEAFSDHEFAFFYQHRLASFLTESREIIELERQRRGLKHLDITNLIGTKISSGPGNCLRCGGDAKYSVKEFEESEIYDIEAIQSSSRCIICGFNPHKSKPLSIRMKIFKMFGYYSSKTIKRFT